MIIRRSPRTSSGRIASEILLRSSAAFRFSHSGLGTTPNIAPPSRRKWRSSRGVSCSCPSVNAQLPTPDSPIPCCSWSKHLRQLDEHSVSSGGMNKGDQGIVGAGPRLLVDQSDALLFQPRQRGTNIVDAERDVVQAGTSFRNVLADRRVGGR